MKVGRNRRGWVVGSTLGLCGLALSAGIAVGGLLGSVGEAGGDWLRHLEAPDVAWESASPAEEGVEAGGLEAVREDITSRGTKAFLVVRGNRVVFEWYAWDVGPNTPHITSALAKSTTAGILLLVAASDGRIGFDDPAWRYIPEWRDDPERSGILVRDLASHGSGLDDVDFVAAQSDTAEPWRKEYYARPGERFERAIRQAPMLFAPGTRARYSGVAYYALAYALGTSLRGAPDGNVVALLEHRVMDPLGIPANQWILSYGAGHEVDGMTLYAIGSGASYTARALARTGQLVLDRGVWNGARIFDEALLDHLLAGSRAPRVPGEPVPGGGWWLNEEAFLPGVPRDAILGYGDQDRSLLIVPSLDLVVVRLGRSLEASERSVMARAAHDRIFAPVVEAVTGPASRPVPKGW